MKTPSALVLALAALSLRVGAQDQTVFMDVAAENLFRYRDHYLRTDTSGVTGDRRPFRGAAGRGRLDPCADTD